VETRIRRRRCLFPSAKKAGPQNRFCRNARTVTVVSMALMFSTRSGDLLTEKPLHDDEKIMAQFLPAVAARRLLQRRTAWPCEKPQGARVFEPADREARPFSRTPRVILAPCTHADSPEISIESNLHGGAGERGNDGLMIKESDSLYTPRKAGQVLVKLKKSWALDHQAFVAPLLRRREDCQDYGESDMSAESKNHSCRVLRERRRFPIKGSKTSAPCDFPRPCLYSCQTFCGTA